MRLLISLAGGLLALGWTALAADYFSGVRRGRSLEKEAPLPWDATDASPALSVVFAACNEEEKLPEALEALARQNYPGRFEIVAVDDRSTDRTGALLDRFALSPPTGKRVRALHVRDLPPGWLGKTHALWQGARASTGDWILFTDADIVFAPDCLSRAVACAERAGCDHLASLFRIVLRGFWEHVFGLCFAFFFTVRFRPWRVSDPRRPEYLGIGGFNLLRRSAYEAIGTHRAIALEVADDMELGRRVKEAGFRSEVIGAADEIRVRWQEGLSGLMGGLIKNAYPSLDYSVAKAILSSALLLLTTGGLVAGLLLSPSHAGRAAYALALASFLGMGAHHACVSGIPAVYALSLPFSPLLLVAVMLRSAYVTEWAGGITWRGTFYPLPVLRQRALPPPPSPVG